MKKRTDKPATSDAVHDKKPRFKIEKLEERIAPRGFYNVHAGKYVGGQRHYPCQPFGCR